MNSSNGILPVSFIPVVDNPTSHGPSIPPTSPPSQSINSDVPPPPGSTGANQETQAEVPDAVKSITGDVPPAPREPTNQETQAEVPEAVISVTGDVAPPPADPSNQETEAEEVNPAEGEAFGENQYENWIGIIGGFLALVQIKSQGDPGFPFETHPGTMRVCVTDLLIYGFASGADDMFSVWWRPARRLTYIRCARMAKRVCLGVMVGALASLFFY